MMSHPSQNAQDSSGPNSSTPEPPKSGQNRAKTTTPPLHELIAQAEREAWDRHKRGPQLQETPPLRPELGERKIISGSTVHHGSLAPPVMPSLPHQNQGSQQLPVTELYQIIHQGPQVDTPARAPVASDLQRSYDITLSQSVNNLPDAIHSNPPRQMISSNVQDDANALDNSHNLQNDAKDLEPSNLQTQDKINLPKYLYPVMNVTDFKNRYEADGIHLARAATRQDRNVKARKFSFCVLDYTSPACKCLRCIKNCLTPCTNENKMLQDCKPNLTRFPRIQNQREVKEEEDQDENDYDDLEEYEAGPVFSECRSTMAPRPSAKKRKHNQTSDHEDQGLKHPMTRARTKAKSSTPKANAKMPRNLTPEPSNSLAAPQIPVHNSDFRMGKYFWFREGVSPQINSILEDMCRGMQEIAHIEYHRGRRDERGAWENGERDIGMDAQSSNKTSRARDDSEEDAEGSEDPGEIGQEVEEDEDEDAKPLKKNLKPGQK